MKTCLQCERTFRGRADKRYCSDYCRAQFNNQQRRTKPSTQQRIHSFLKQNHRILTQLLRERKSIRIEETQLVELGFRLRYVTHWVEAPEQPTRFGCYEFEWQKTKAGFIEVQKTKSAIGTRLTIRV